MHRCLFARFFVAIFMVPEDEFAKDDEVMADMAKIKRKSTGKRAVPIGDAAEALWGELGADDVRFLSRTPESLENMRRPPRAFQVCSG